MPLQAVDASGSVGRGSHHAVVPPRMAATSSVMSIATGHHVMQRPQPTQPETPILIDPRGQLVRQPLAVARADVGPHVPAGGVGMVEVEARIPEADPLAALAVKVGDVFDRVAEAGRADHGAVGARQAAAGHVVPAGMLQVIVEQLGQVGRVEPARDLALGVADNACRRAQILRRWPRGRERPP